MHIREIGNHHRDQRERQSLMDQRHGNIDHDNSVVIPTATCSTMSTAMHGNQA